MNKKSPNENSPPDSPPVPRAAPEKKRSPTNIDLGRRWLRTVAEMLKHPSHPSEREIAIDVAVDVFEAIADGEDPLEVVAGGSPNKTDRHANALVTVIELRKHVHGYSTHAAVKSVCEQWPDHDFEQVRAVYNRNKDKYPFDYEAYKLRT